MVEQGSVSTSMSLSASISTIDAQTFTSDESTSVRTIFVTQDQEVKTGDKLIQLANGEIYTANFDGTVNEIRVAQGDIVRRNGTLLQVCDLQHLQVSMVVDEYDIANVSVGQKCTVTVIPLEFSFETQIKHINKVSSSSGSVAYYTVTALADVQDNVLPGMGATVTIKENEAVDVPVVSMEAIAYDAENNPYVLRRDAQGMYTRQTIEVGLVDGMQAQVLSGLSIGDEVWAVTGSVQIESTFSLAQLYKTVAGEKIVINDRTGSGRGGNRDRQSGGERPQGMGATPSEAGQMPEGMTLPEGMELPEGMTGPPGMGSDDSTQSPEGADVPSDTNLPDGSDAAAETQPTDISGESGDKTARKDKQQPETTQSDNDRLQSGGENNE